MASDQGRPQEQRQQHAPDGGRDGRCAEHRLFGGQDNSRSQRSRPRKRDDERRIARHNVR